MRRLLIADDDVQIARAEFVEEDIDDEQIAQLDGDGALLMRAFVRAADEHQVRIVRAGRHLIAGNQDELGFGFAVLGGVVFVAMMAQLILLKPKVANME